MGTAVAEPLFFMKAGPGLVPADTPAQDYLQKIKLGDVVQVVVKRVRNYKFHKKLFALFNFAFDNWDAPVVMTKWGAARKTFDRFRKDITILAGYYEIVVRVDGSTVVEAKSLKFANMDQDTFDKLYTDVWHVIQDRILKDYLEDDLERVLEQLAQF